MFGSVILDVFIGLILVFLLLSLICSAIREGLAGFSGVRAKMLERGIVELLQHDAKLVADFYSHPQIWSLYKGSYADAKVSARFRGKPLQFLSFLKNSLPSYIPSRSFAMALLDMAARGRNSASPLQASGEANVLNVQTVRQNVCNIGNPFVQRLVLTAADTSGDNLDKARESLEKWFDASMDRVSGWYKRRTQIGLFFIGVIITVILDVDAVAIAKRLYRDPAQREIAVAMARSIVASDSARAARASSGATAGRDTNRTATRDTSKTATPPPSEVARTAYARLDSLGLPAAWPGVKITGMWPDPGEWKPIFDHAGHAAIGWLLTAFAISFGAPFWFDTLNKIMVIRSTVKPGEKSPEEGSEDRPLKGGGTTGGPMVTVVSATAPGSSAPAASQARAPARAVAMDPEFEPHEWTSGRPDGGVL